MKRKVSLILMALLLWTMVFDDVRAEECATAASKTMVMEESDGKSGEIVVDSSENDASGDEEPELYKELATDDWFPFLMIGIGVVVAGILGVSVVLIIKKKKNRAAFFERSDKENSQSENLLLVCPHCGASIPEDSRFCENCGHPVEMDLYEENGSDQQYGKKQKRTGLIVGGIVAGIIVLLAGVLLFVFRDRLFHKKEQSMDENIVIEEEQQEEKEEQEEQEEQKEQEEKEQEEQEEQNEIQLKPSVTEPLERSESQPESPEPSVTEIPKPVENEITPPQENQESPVLEDFLWYEELKAIGGWNDAIITTDFNDMIGGWKGYLVYDPDWETGKCERDLVKVCIDGSASAVTLTIDWQTMIPEGENPVDVSNWEDTVFTGSYANETMHLTGSGNVYIYSFAFRNGKEYALGTLDAPDGTYAHFLMVRP